MSFQAASRSARAATPESIELIVPAGEASWTGAPVARKMTASLRRIASAGAFQRPMLRRGFGLAYADGAEFAGYMAEEQAACEVAMAAIGTGPYEGSKMRRPSSPPDGGSVGEAPPRQSYGAAPL